MTTTPFIDTVLISSRIALTRQRPRRSCRRGPPTGGGHRAGLGHPGQFKRQVAVRRMPFWLGRSLAGRAGSAPVAVSFSVIADVPSL